MVRNNIGPKIAQEQQTIRCMIQLYCRKQHLSSSTLCQECAELEAYALRRLTLCRFGEDKPTCEKCPRHCYRSDYKQRIKIVMRYAGPRMLLYHPIMAIRHVIKNLRKGKQGE